MFQKQRTVLYLGEGISLDSYGVIYFQSPQGFVVSRLDEYSSLKNISGWKTDKYEVKSGVIELSPMAFYGALFKSCTLPDGLKAIKEYAFSDCQSLEELDIPNSVTYVDLEAFSGCTSLHKLSLPDSFCFGSQNPFSSTEELYPDFLKDSLNTLECIMIPRDKRTQLEELLPHLKHLFVEK